MEFTREVLIDALVETGFEAWTNSDVNSKWFAIDVVIDAFNRGTYSNNDGDKGAFLEAVENRRLPITWDNEHHYHGTIVQTDCIPEGPDKHPIRLVHGQIEDLTGAGT